MYGFPQHLNTKQDYLNCLPGKPEETRAELRKVFDARMTWQPVRKLKDGESPKESATKKIMEIPVETMAGIDMAEPQTERWLFEFKEDATAWFFRLGFTVEEAQEILAAE
jgi:hypothetical protein